MGAFLRKVRTASGATAVQIVEKRNGVRTIVEHLGSAHDEAELTALMEAGRARLAGPDQEMLDFGPSRIPQSAVVTGKRSAVLIEVIDHAWQLLGFDCVDDEAFFQLVLARLVEPASMLDSARIVTELGLTPVRWETMRHCLERISRRDYRDQLAGACHRHALNQAGRLSHVLYDVTTLHFSAEHDDSVEDIEYVKRRRVDPRIIVGLLVDRHGFPLEVGPWGADQEETVTIVPTAQRFRGRYPGSDLVVVADVGVLSMNNLGALEEAGLRFIIGSRMAKAPGDLPLYFRWHGGAFADGQLIDTITPHTDNASGKNAGDSCLEIESARVQDMFPQSWRAVWRYSRTRAQRDERTLRRQEAKARRVVNVEQMARVPRFVEVRDGVAELGQDALDRARSLVGLKGYVTNIPADVMPAREIVDSYHDLWHVEQFFRMSEDDLGARPIFHRDAESIDAHLTIEFAALAIARHLQKASGLRLKELIRRLRPLQEMTVSIAGQTITATPRIDDDTNHIIERLLGR